jgi:hypothetical protein
MEWGRESRKWTGKAVWVMSCERGILLSLITRLLFCYHHDHVILVELTEESLGIRVCESNNNTYTSSETGFQERRESKKTVTSHELPQRSYMKDPCPKTTGWTTLCLSTAKCFRCLVGTCSHQQGRESKGPPVKERDRNLGGEDAGNEKKRNKARDM